MIYRMLIAFLLFCSLVYAEAEWMDPVRDFSGGISPSVSPGNLAPNEMTQAENFVLKGSHLKLRQGFVDWATIDTLAKPIRELYEFYNDVTGESQVMAAVGDQVYFLSDDSSTAYRIGIVSAGQSLLLQENDTIARATGTHWLKHILPEDGRDWRLYVYVETGTYSFPIYRVLSDNHLKLDSANTSGLFWNQANFALVPSFDTTNSLHFETWNQTCFIADGVHPVRKWTGRDLDNRHYIIDSAVIGNATYDTTLGVTALTLDLSTGLTNNTPSGLITEYGEAHYSVIYDLDEPWPYGTQEAIMRMPIAFSPSDSQLVVFADLIDQDALVADQKIFVVAPCLESYSFAADTVLSGVADSIVQHDTVVAWATVFDTVLTQGRDTTIAAAAESVEVSLDISYNSVDDYQVVFAYGDWYESRIMVRKVDTDKFRLIRPPVDNAVAQDLHWIAVGIPGDADSADGHTDGNNWLWQWGEEEMHLYYPFRDPKDTVDLTYSYSATADYSVGLASASQIWYNLDGSKYGLPYVEKAAVNKLHYYDSTWWQPLYRWATVGDADVGGEANSDDDSVLVQWGLDTLAVGEYLKTVYFDNPYTNSCQVIISTVDTNSGSVRDTIENRIIAPSVTNRWFKISREFANVAQYVSWIAVGSQHRIYPDTNYVTLVFDHDVFVSDSINKNEDLFTAPHLFKITDGPGSEDPWWSLGTPCAWHRTEDDSLALRIIAPSYGFDSNAVDLPPRDSASYVILRLIQYPPTRFAKADQQRMFFLSSADFPDMMWMSDLYKHNVVSTANYQEIGGDDDDRVMCLGGLFGQRWIYKMRQTYAQTGNDPDLLDTRLRQNRGSGSDGFNLCYENLEFGVNANEFFAFNGTSMPIISRPIETFFTDSINLTKLNLIRGVVVGDNLLISYPHSGSTANDKTLWFDIPADRWFTSTLVAPSYVKRTSPVGLDSILIAHGDSARLYAYGGISDAGADIVAKYKSGFLDWGTPESKKTLEKIEVRSRLNKNGSWIVRLYQDDLDVVTWTDTITSSTPGTTWDKDQINIPALPEFYRLAVELETLSADTVELDMWRAKVRIKGEGGSL